MTKLLISVKNVEESRVALYAGVDVIDLKEPSIGALGALTPEVVKQIVREIDGRTVVTATVGEGHATATALKSDVALYASLGVDVIKVAVTPLFQQTQFFDELRPLLAQGVKLVAVFFADQTSDFRLVDSLQANGFYGAMLDTQQKQKSLLAVQPTKVLADFVRTCKQNNLISGLAGSVSSQHVEELLTLSPTFIGMRGSVCHGKKRRAELDVERINAVKEVLLNCNNMLEKV